MPYTQTTFLPAIAGALTLLLAGCQVNPHADYERASQLVRTSTGCDASHDPQVAALEGAALEAQLADGLALDEAVRIALANNRQLQASFLEIGIARADYVQSGLLSNPSLGVSVLLPEGGGRTNLQAGLAQNIVDLWQIPVKRRIASQRLEQTILRIAWQAAELVNSTRRAYFTAAASAQMARLAEENVGVLAKSYEAIRARREAGAVGELDENLARGELLQAQLTQRDADLAAATARRQLARLLSVEQDLATVPLTDELPAGSPEDLDAERLIAQARQQRLDLKALREASLASGQAIRLEYRRIFPEIGVGPFVERMERQAGEGEGIDTITGPSISMTLPIFDQNQAQVAKARYTHVQAVRSYEDLYLGIAHDIRIAAARATVRRSQVAFYRDQVIPQAARNVDFSEAAFRAGSADIVTLLQAQRTAIQVRQAYLTAWAEAATAWADLELAVGVPLSQMDSAGAPASQTAAAQVAMEEERSCPAHGSAKPVD